MESPSEYIVGEDLPSSISSLYRLFEFSESIIVCRTVVLSCSYPHGTRQPLFARGSNLVPIAHSATRETALAAFSSRRHTAEFCEIKQKHAAATDSKTLDR